MLTKIVHVLKGILNRMHRNSKGANEISRLGLNKQDLTEIGVQSVLEIVKEIRNDVKQYTFHVRMDCTDISDFFPLENDESLER